MNRPRPCLSVAVPCFDEADTVAALVDRVLASPWVAQVIVVDDGSTDGTAKVLADLVAELGDPRLDVVTHERNRGKGGVAQRLRACHPRVRGCYKCFRREVVEGIMIHEDRFGVEPELTAKVAEAAGGSTRLASPTAGAPTPRATRSAGETACGPRSA